MPVVNIQMFEGRDDAKPAIAEAVTRAISEFAKVEPEYIYVIFSDIQKDNWAVSGEIVSTTTNKTGDDIQKP
ncbi:Probable tautomerase ywhB [Serratia ficaria]|uniref:tautomerase family protein n=1 Tax=Enterobacterales TaxID=91347 RepID=UPI000F7E2AB7|nr:MULTISPECIES: 4-oxalocrotonate tautomerase family protein [Enterobacterales]RSV89041.1 4-oxalocrotonate tautomerase family protein [Klebsiella aerogenes]CAI1805668.1 Probable tautomerase ywhB [Serratia ficaria]